MPDAAEKPRPWYRVKRIQGLIVMSLGAVMSLIPATAPAANTITIIGASWGGIGVGDAVRKKVLK